VRKYINDVGPCDNVLTRSGKTLFNSIVPEYILNFGELNGVVYKGPTASAKEVIISML